MMIVVSEPIVAIRKDDGELTLIWYKDREWMEFDMELLCDGMAIELELPYKGTLWNVEDLDVQDYDLLGNL